MFKHALLALALTVSAAAAQPVKTGDLTIEAARTFATPPSARSAGAYLSITNTGDTADALIGVAADFPRVELHETREEGGVMKMRPVPRLEIAPGTTVHLAPGGLHIMIMGLDAPFAEGDEIPIALTFERAGTTRVLLPVLDARMKGRGMWNSPWN